MVENSATLFLETANRIGLNLCRDAMWDQHRCTWLGWSMQTIQKKTVPVYVSVGAELYGGTSGIALFLAELYQFTNDKQQLRAIEGAINQALSVHDRIPVSNRHGFYAGACGIAYAFLRIGHILKRDGLIARGEKILDEMRPLAFDSQKIDVITGSAGAIPAILNMAKTLQRPDLLEWAIAHGDHLLALAESNELGMSWRTLSHSVFANLTGHSHGVAGIVTALLELHHASEEQRFLDAALQGLRYEQHWYSDAHQNWHDLRNRNSGKMKAENDMNCSLAWCHGAPGIGLSRLRNLDLLAHKVELERDLEVAISTTAASLSREFVAGSRNYSLCHGAGGNAELMIAAGHALRRPELIQIAEKVGIDGLQFYTQQGLPWPCGTAGVGEMPGLMLGLAGIGHFYLRLHDAVKVPSVLLIKGS